MCIIYVNYTVELLSMILFLQIIDPKLLNVKEMRYNMPIYHSVHINYDLSYFKLVNTVIFYKKSSTMFFLFLIFTQIHSW